MSVHVTILMPVFNGLEFLQESVPSVLKQTYQNWTLMIGVNGYCENSKEFQETKKLRELDTRIQVFDFHFCKGKVQTLLEMLQHIDRNSEWVSLLDVDDIWLPLKLEKQIPFTKEFDVIGTMCQRFEDNTEIPLLSMYDISKTNFFVSNPIVNSSVLIRKCYCQWTADMVVEDYELWIKLRVQNKKFYNVPDVLVRHRVHRQSAFNTKDFSKEIESMKQKYLLS